MVKRKRLKESADTLYKIVVFAKRIKSQRELNNLLAQSTPQGCRSLGDTSSL